MSSEGIRLSDLAKKKHGDETVHLAAAISKSVMARVDALAKLLKSKKRETIEALLNEGLASNERKMKEKEEKAA